MARFQVAPISPAVVAAAARRLAAGDPAVSLRTVDAPSGYPCRLTLQEAKPGERVLLFRHRPFDAVTPYTEEGPIFARLDAAPAHLPPGALPDFMAQRKLLTVRRYDRAGAIAGAEVVPPEACAETIAHALEHANVDYVHVRNAGYGCFLFRADRAA
ncbi:MAG: DUF1203 domain-containing protein [Alphaproteobacteria bacterium]|nr:DUF1203 domain-containing protein [Alphaproteobacteria bacterium]